MHSISTLSLVLLTAAAAAQPTLQYADFPTSALTLNWYVLTSPGSVTDPSSGTGQTWDWTSAAWVLAGTVSIAPAVGTPYAADFPEANYVFTTTPTGGPSIYAYLLVDATGIQTICGDAPLNTEVYTNYKTILRTPLSFNESFTDTNDGTQGPDGETWTYTGAGTLLTDYGNFANTVKTSRMADNRTALWNSAPIFPRITGNSQGVNLYTDAGTSIGEAGIRSAALTLYPTTGTNTITVRGVAAGARWIIVDAQGRRMGNGTFRTPGDQQLAIGELAVGPYRLQVTDAAGSRTAPFEKL